MNGVIRIWDFGKPLQCKQILEYIPAQLRFHLLDIVPLVVAKIS
jgi:hypothetical protein